jgi:hypothetical protein
VKYILDAREEPKKGRGKSGQRRVVVKTSIAGIFFEIMDNQHRDHWNRSAFEVTFCESDPERVFGYQATTIGHCDLVSSGMQIIRKYLDDHPGIGKERGEKSKYNVAYLPAGNNSDFFPTPSKLAGRMLAKVQWAHVDAVLEPSAGKGDLVDATVRYGHSSVNSDLYRCHREDIEKMFDVVEMDINLRLILRGRELRLVHDDFLTYFPQKRYDVIVMNPPFSEGAKHLLHAIDLQKNGGQIVCLLNAETVRNPFNRERQMLKQKLSELNASIEFVKDAFKHAERASDVEVAIVYISIPKRKPTSALFEKLENESEHYEFPGSVAGQQMVLADELKALVQHYDFEAKLGIAMLEEYSAMAPNIMEGSNQYAKPLIQLCVNDRKYSQINNSIVNAYLCELRSKYWHLLLEQPSIRSKLTSQMSSDYYEKVRKMRDYPFSLHNIMQVVFDVQEQLQQGVVDSIMALFEKFTEHAYWPECEKNIHYYTGWTTNQAHKVGKKIILPIHGYCSYSWKKNELDSRYIDGIFSDLERALCFLSKGERTPRSTYIHVLDQANESGKNEICCEFFSAKFYKKGTCHLTFHDSAMPLIDRLNIFAARQRGWLPPNYGKKPYKDLEEHEREVIDSFQGAQAYDEVVKDPGNYILEPASLQPLLTA